MTLNSRRDSLSQIISKSAKGRFAVLIRTPFHPLPPMCDSLSSHIDYREPWGLVISYRLMMSRFGFQFIESTNIIQMFTFGAAAIVTGSGPQCGSLQKPQVLGSSSDDTNCICYIGFSICYSL